jgi:hypothetical protein
MLLHRAHPSAKFGFEEFQKYLEKSMNIQYKGHELKGLTFQRCPGDGEHGNVLSS